MSKDDHSPLDGPSGPETGVGESEDADEQVGYRRPPKRSRFRPGQSGNPRGRPRGQLSLFATARKILDQMVTVTEHGRTRRIRRL